MKRITYVGTAVLVDDEFGTVLLEYAAALARDGSSETILFRGVNERDLREEEVSFIVGPASEIVVEGLPDEIPAVAPDNTDIIERMHARTRELKRLADRGGHVITPQPANETSPLVDGLDI